MECFCVSHRREGEGLSDNLQSLWGCTLLFVSFPYAESSFNCTANELSFVILELA